MKKATTYQLFRLANADLEEEELRLWQEFGFSEEEAKSMMAAPTYGEAVEKHGGVYRADNVEFSQAISAEHARKLYVWNFGDEPERVDKLIAIREGSTLVVPRP